MQAVSGIQNIKHSRFPPRDGERGSTAAPTCIIFSGSTFQIKIEKSIHEQSNQCIDGTETQKK